MEGWITAVVVAIAWVGREVAANYFQFRRRREEIRFSELQSRRAEIIAELHSKIVDVSGALNAWHHTVKAGNESSDEIRDGFNHAYTQLYNFYQHRSVWLPPRLCTQLEAISDEFDRHSSTLLAHELDIGVDDRGRLGPAEQMGVPSLDDLNSIRKSIQRLQIMVRQEFREILGADR